MPLVKGRNAPQNIFLETLAKKFDGSISNFVLGNAQSIQDYPIVYCSDGFCQLTGYSRAEVMRKSCCCKFLVGIETERDVVYKLMKALHSQTEMKAEVLFYKKNGAPFWCLLDLMPIKNENSEVVLFLVSHKDITKSKLSASENDFDSSKDSVGNGSCSEPAVPRFRKFSRDVLLHIQRQYNGKSVTSHNSSKFPSSGTTSVGESSSFIPQYKLENAKLPRFMILHFGRPRLIWDWIILVLVCYIAIMVPFNVAFKAHDHRKELIVADCIVEVFFIFDIFINFRTTYIDKKSGRIITQRKLIAKHYLQRWFIIDFLAALPFEALYFIDHSWGFLVSLLKTGRLLRLFRIARRISRYIEYTAALLGLLMFSFAMLGHWFACIWYVIGYEEFKRKETNGWLYGLGDQMGQPYVNSSLASGPSKGEAYISSLYFILTSLTTVGFGNIAPNTAVEKIFSVVVLLLGALMQSAIFGNMTAVIQKLYAVRARFHAKAAEIKQFVRLHRIENDLKRRIEDYFLTHWSVSKGVDSDEMLESFPSELRADICLHMYTNFLSLPCFADASRGCWRLLSLKVKRAYFGPGELILKERDAIDAIFFVNSGTIEIVQRECIVAILGSGDLFGDDVSRKVPIRRSNGDVRALTYCDLLYLTRENFLGVTHLYPDFAEAFSLKLEMTFNLGMKERDLSTCGALDSITEGDEEEEEELSESAEEDAHEDRSLLGTGTVASPPSPALPLWQQQLRKRERGLSNPMATSPTLEERLMRISTDSSSHDSESDKDAESGFTHQNAKQSWPLQDDFNNRREKVDIELTTQRSSPCQSTQSMETELKPSQKSSYDMAETAFNGDGVDDNDIGYLGDLARGPIDYRLQNNTDLLGLDTENEKEIESVVTSQTLLISREDVTSDMLEKVPSIAGSNHIDHIENSRNRHKTLLNTLPRPVWRKKCEKSRCSLPDLSDESSIKLETRAFHTDSHEDAPSSTSAPNVRRKRGAILKCPWVGDENQKNVNASLVHENGVPDVKNEPVDLGVGEQLRESTDMSWDMLCPSFVDGDNHTGSKSTEGNDQHALRQQKSLKLPKRHIERLSSGVFSRELSESDSGSESTDELSSRNRECQNSEQSCNCSENVSCISSNDIKPAFNDVSTRTRISLPKDTNFVAPQPFDAEYFSNAHEELSKEVRTTRKSVEGIEQALLVSKGSNGLVSIGHLANDLSESKAAIHEMSSRLDRLSYDVNNLKGEVHSLTALVRIMIERQDSMC